MYFRDNIYVIKTLKEFQYIDEEGKDQGANVRQKAKDITNLLQDDGRLRDERRNRAHMRDRMTRGPDGVGDDDEPDVDNENAHRRNRTGALNGKRSNKDEDELRRAIEESKKSLAQEQATAEERDLEKALRLSEEEEKKRNKAVEDSNSSSLFDEQNQLCVISLPPPFFLYALTVPHRASCRPSPSSSTNPFPLVDTALYSAGLQPQLTQIQPQFTQMQPQFTAFSSFNPYQQQAQQEAMQVRIIISLCHNPLGCLTILAGRVHAPATRVDAATTTPAAAAAATAATPTATIPAAAATTRSYRSLDAAATATTTHPNTTHGLRVCPICSHLRITLTTSFYRSNNPFAPASAAPPVPSFSTASVSSQSSLPSFNLPGTYANTNSSVASSFSPAPSSSSSPRPPSATSAGVSSHAPTKADQDHAHLASLFASRDDGQDTFGNIGPLRCVHLFFCVLLRAELLKQMLVCLFCFVGTGRRRLGGCLRRRRRDQGRRRGRITLSTSSSMSESDNVI